MCKKKAQIIAAVRGKQAWNRDGDGSSSAPPSETNSPSASGKDLGANGDAIRCNSVHPGIIITPLWGKMFPDDPSFQMGSNDLDPAKRMKRNIPVGRSGSAQDIANGILFLSSDASSYMNGSELVIDGGVTAA